MRFYPLVVLTLAGFLSSGSGAVVGQDFTEPDAVTGCDSLPVEERDYASLTYTIRSTEKRRTESEGMWKDYKTTVFFSGEVKLAFAYAPNCPGVDRDLLAPEGPTPIAPSAQSLSPYLETELMMAGMTACQRETDQTKMIECMSQATDRAAQLFAECEAAPADARPDFCRTSGDVTETGDNADTGSDEDFDLADDGGEGQSETDQAPTQASTGTSSTSWMDHLPPGMKIPDGWLTQNQIIVFRALNCIGSTDVTGSGTGYDSSYLRQPNFSFGISGHWQANPDFPGSTQGCSAGVIVNRETGEVHITLAPGPGRIQTVWSYNNYLGKVEQTIEAFPGLPNRIADILLYIDVNTPDFRDTIDLPDVHPTPDSLVTTTVSYSFASTV